MRSYLLARVVMACLGVSLISTVGCGDPPTEPTGVIFKGPNAFRLSTLSISPTEGPIAGGTVVTIRGFEFQSATTVTIDGNRVDASVLDAKTITVVMPAHAGGSVDLAIIRTPGAEPVVARGRYRYAAPPVITQLYPTVGSTVGGAPLIIVGSGIWSATTVTLDGVSIPFDSGWGDELYLTTPAHAAGPVEVVITDRWGQTGRAMFTYASPETLDFNGEWEGWTPSLGPSDFGAYVVLTVRENMVVSVSCTVCRPNENCATAGQSVMLDPPQVVNNGEFSFAGNGVGVTGKILSPTQATGSISTASCGSRQWGANKKQ